VLEDLQAPLQQHFEDLWVTQLDCMCCCCCAGIVLEDLQAPLQQHFEELRVTDPRLYFRVQQQQQQAPVKQAPQQQQQQDVVQRLRGVDPLGLLEPPMASAAARQVSLF
jgi:hypothetical protein